MGNQHDETRVQDAADRLFTIAEAVADPASPLCRSISKRGLYTLAQKHPEKLGVVQLGRRIFLTILGMRAFVAAGGTRVIEPITIEVPALKVVSK